MVLRCAKQRALSLYNVIRTCLYLPQKMTDAVEDAATAVELKGTPTMAQSEASTTSTAPAPAQAAARNGPQREWIASQPPPQHAVPQDPTTSTPLSKNQLKKLKKKQDWEASRDDRKVKRRIKIRARKERRRENPEVYSAWQQTKRSAAASATQTPVPITVVYDCSYDELMNETELVSLASQLTRAYSDNRKAIWRPKMVVSSFGGRLRERFKTVLNRTNENWKGVEFLEGDFVEAARRAGELRGKVMETWKECVALAGEEVIDGAMDGGVMKGEKEENGANGTVINDEKEENGANGAASSTHNTDAPQPPTSNPLSDTSTGETIYLSSDSPNTLTSLKPHSTYIIGALVDKNRHKGACYKAACSKDVKTAKLPIREFMQMSSRQVLATSHVGEIMLKWLEYGDWGRAFMEVIPTRKGGVLRENGKGNGKRKGGKDAKVDEADGNRRDVEDCVVGEDDEDDGDEGEDGEGDEDENTIEEDGREEDHGGDESKKRKAQEDTPAASTEPSPNKRIRTSTRGEERKNDDPSQLG